MDASRLAPRQQPGVFEHTQVPRNRRQRHLERFGQFAGGRLATGQTFEHAAPDRIGQSRKSDVEMRGSILNHSVNYKESTKGSQI
jgi:hypothetical protein